MISISLHRLSHIREVHHQQLGKGFRRSEMWSAGHRSTPGPQDGCQVRAVGCSLCCRQNDAPHKKEQMQAVFETCNTCI